MLTPSQENALVILSKLDHPTLEEWAHALNASFSTARHYQGILTDRGLITSTPGKSRSTRLTDAGLKYLKG